MPYGEPPKTDFQKFIRVGKNCKMRMIKNSITELFHFLFSLSAFSIADKNILLHPYRMNNGLLRSRVILGGLCFVGGNNGLLILEEKENAISLSLL